MSNESFISNFTNPNPLLKFNHPIFTTKNEVEEIIKTNYFPLFYINLELFSR